MFETQSSQLLLCFSVTPACIIVTSIKPESWSFYIKSFSKLFDLNRWKSSEPVGVTKHHKGVILLPGEDSRLTATLTWRTSVVLSLQHNSSRNLQHVGAAAASERASEALDRNNAAFKKDWIIRTKGNKSIDSSSCWKYSQEKQTHGKVEWRTTGRWSVHTAGDSWRAEQASAGLR